MKKTYEDGYRDGFKDGFAQGQPKVNVQPFIHWGTTGTGEGSSCMHENCPGCKAGTCSGLHMISCPCSKCSPRMTA